MGRRRPFLVIFHVGSIIGLSLIVWSEQLVALLLAHAPASLSSHSHMLLIVIIFIGFAIADLCHDLLLMPARALLNDRLPDEQSDEGNSYFASVSSIGTCVGLGLTIAPTETVWPFTYLKVPIRSTFTIASMIIALQMIVTLSQSRGVDQPYEPDEEEDEEDEDEEEHHSNTHNQQHKEIQCASSVKSINNEFSPSDTVEARHTATVSSTSSPSYSGVTNVISVFGMLPRPLKYIWLLQMSWWYAVLHVNIYFTSWMSVDFFRAGSEEAHALSDNTSMSYTTAIRLATAALLLQAIMSFAFSPVQPYANKLFGITNCFHLSSIIFGLSVSCIYFVNSYWQTLLIMVLLGATLPPIFSSAYTLIEVYANEGENSDSDSDADKQQSPGDRSPSLLPCSLSSVGASPSIPTECVVLHNCGSSPSASPSPREYFTPKSFDSPPLTPERTATSDAHQSLVIASEPVTPYSLRPAHSALMASPVLQLTPQLPSLILNEQTTNVSSVVKIQEEQQADDGQVEETDVEDQEFSLAVLDEQRGTITAIFNVTMIVSQIIVGTTSGLLIDYWGNINIVFVLSGSIVVLTNLIVLAFKLSKPREQDNKSSKVNQQTVRQETNQTKKKTEDELTPLLAAPLIVRSPHPPVSPPLSAYGSTWERVPHIIGGHAAEQAGVRPLGMVFRQQHHMHQPTLVRSTSAPDLQLAIKQIKKEKKIRAPHVRVAVYQPRGAAFRNVRVHATGIRNTRVPDTNVHPITLSQHQYIERIQQRRAERNAERVRLFGEAVSKRAAALKERVKAGGSLFTLSEPRRRNNQSREKPQPSTDEKQRDNIDRFHWSDSLQPPFSSLSTSTPSSSSSAREVVTIVPLPQQGSAAESRLVDQLAIASVLQESSTMQSSSSSSSSVSSPSSTSTLSILMPPQITSMEEASRSSNQQPAVIIHQFQQRSIQLMQHQQNALTLPATLQVEEINNIDINKKPIIE